MDTYSFIAYICFAVAAYVGSVRGQVLMEELRMKDIDPLSMNDTEPYTELTIDKIISRTMGGYGRFANMMVGPDGKILAELDMYLSQDQYFNLYEEDHFDTISGRKRRNARKSRRTKRKAIRDPILRWPNATVPYVFATGHFSDEEMYKIKSSMTEWERYTCLRFRPAHHNERNYVRFQDGMGCNSQLGMVGGAQALNLDKNGCRFKGLYLHEIGHAVGLVHEHQLPNRDKYIEILYQHVQPNMRVWFNKYSPAKVNQMDVEYEYSSVMHYGITAFSYNDKAQTIRAKIPGKEETIGRVYKKQLAFSDVKIVNLMYNCAAHCPKNIVCNDRGFVDQNCKCICPNGTDDCTKTPEEKAAVDNSCSDSHSPWQCYVWANQGECERNPRFMLDMCRKSCRLCPDEAEEKDPHMALWSWQWLCQFASICPMDWSIDDTCKDKFDTAKCLKWKERGECITNKKWMKTNCKKTCKACGDNSNDPDVACENKHQNTTSCEKWASEGECFINPTWMPENCRKSCRMCGDSWKPVTTTPRPDPDDGGNGICEDTYNTVECQAWAASNECLKNPRWMIPNCRKSCNKCQKNECKNTWDDQSCEMWSRDQECMKNRDWMTENCYRSCSGCSPDKDEGRQTRPTTARPPVTTSGTIRNNHRNEAECDNWARHGHCEINEWMLKHCALSCKNHREGRNSVTTTKRPDQDRGGNNDDNNNNNNDDNNYDPRCQDSVVHCVSWARNGFCEDNPNTALRMCKRSCGICGKSAADCHDNKMLCPVWANRGHCQTNGGYMLRNCRKSCGNC